jgi:RimJ/RimL family protein N-acetyltransferase
MLQAFLAALIVMDPRAEPQSLEIRVDTLAGVATLRDLGVADLDRIVAYFHATDDAHLDGLIDRARLGSPEDTRQRFRDAIRTGDERQRRVAFAITLDGEFVGFTNLNRYAPDVNHSHWHISEARYRAKGLSTVLYPYRMKLYFDLFPIARIIHQTRVQNVGVNRMLDRYVPVAATRFIAQPDGVARPGEFHLRHVYRDDVPRFFAVAAELRENRSLEPL